MFGAILGPALGIAGSLYGASRDRKAAKQAMGMQLADRQRAMELLDAGETRASDFLRQALSAVDTAGNRALGQTAASEFQGYRALGDAFRGGQSRLAQSLVGRGLYGSSVGNAGYRGLYADYARGVGQLSAGIGGLRAQIEQNRGSAQASVYGSLADTATRFASNRAATQQSIQYQDPGGRAESYGVLGQSVGGLLGGALDGWSSWASRRSQSRQASAALGGIGAASNAAGRALGPTPWGYALQGYGSALRRNR